MNKDKYVAMDVHKASVSVAVRNAEGKIIAESTVETKASTLLSLIRGLEGPIHLTFEEGTQSRWLFDLLSPHVAECVVCDPRKNKLLKEGNKSDRIDVRKLSELLYSGSLRAVYHGDHGTRALKEMVHGYEAMVGDKTRVMNRLKAIYRGRGIECEGERCYGEKGREEWLSKLSERGVKQRTEALYHQLDSLDALVHEGRKELLVESRKHMATKILKGICGIGQVWAAMIVATVDTPHRFRTKRQFWTYCGLAVVTRTSSDYVFKKGELQKRKKPPETRGLNRNHNHRLKNVFKSAAATASQKGPFKPFYDRLIARGLSPELAKVTLARKISAIALALWKKGEEFDPEKVLKLAV